MVTGRIIETNRDRVSVNLSENKNEKKMCRIVRPKLDVHKQHVYDRHNVRTGRVIG